MLLFHRVHLLVDLSWLTTWLTEMPKVVSASAGVLPVWVRVCVVSQNRPTLFPGWMS